MRRDVTGINSGKAVCSMEFLSAIVTYGLKFIVLGAVAFGAILLGIFLRKRKNASIAAEENE